MRKVKVNDVMLNEKFHGANCTNIDEIFEAVEVAAKEHGLQLELAETGTNIYFLRLVKKQIRHGRAKVAS